METQTIRKTDEELKAIAQEKWTFKANKSDDELKQIAKDLYNGLIFCDRHCRQNEVSMVFMILMLMGPQSPSNPSKDTDTQGRRDNLIYDLIQKEQDQKLYEYELEVYNKDYLTQIGLVYEYLNSPNISPRSINGMPSFMSCRFLSRDEAKKTFEYYEQYKEIREKADNF